jgi:P27 family predicted phage terminase small subunit
MRGPKPKPVALRVLHGTAAERARESIPQPRRALPRCPDHLDGEAAACWRRLARELYDAGLLSNIDRDALANYCLAYARHKKAEAMITKSSEMLKAADEKDSDGNVTHVGGFYQNPWLSIANKAAETMLKLAAEFGMTPSSRSRVKAEIAAAREQKARPPRPQIVKRDTDEEDPRRALGM